MVGLLQLHPGRAVFILEVPGRDHPQLDAQFFCSPGGSHRTGGFARVCQQTAVERLVTLSVGVLVYFFLKPVCQKYAWAGTGSIYRALKRDCGCHGARDQPAKDLDPIVVTGISMGFGSILLLASGVSFQGLPPLSPRSWLILIVLAVFNTALAFWLWNKSLQVLTAMESSIINNTMLIQISLLAWLFLGEKLTWMGVIGLAIASIGTILVNLSLLEKSNNFVDFYGLVLDTLSAQADPERLY